MHHNRSDVGGFFGRTANSGDGSLQIPAEHRKERGRDLRFAEPTPACRRVDIINVSQGSSPIALHRNHIDQGDSHHQVLPVPMLHRLAAENCQRISRSAPVAPPGKPSQYQSAPPIPPKTNHQRTCGTHLLDHVFTNRR